MRHQQGEALREYCIPRVSPAASRKGEPWPLSLLRSPRETDTAAQA
jgi:hypothetical protein